MPWQIFFKVHEIDNLDTSFCDLAVVRNSGTSDISLKDIRKPYAHPLLIFELLKTFEALTGLDLVIYKLEFVNGL